MKLCEIGLLHVVWGVSQVPVIIIMRFAENNVLEQNVSIYMNFEGYREDIHIPLSFFCSLFKKTEKVQEHGLY